MDDKGELAILTATLGVSAVFLQKLLGPTADYLGDGLQNWTAKRIENIGRVFKKTERKIGFQIEREGKIPPRVLKEILDEASFVDDELMATYFGGVLAASRSEVSRDDRGTTFIKLIARLSSYQVRAHYIFYTLWKKKLDGTELNFRMGNDRRKMTIYLSDIMFDESMDFSESEKTEGYEILVHILNGLVRENLLGEIYAIGTTEYMQEYCSKANRLGFIIEPSLFGTELYLWANGFSHIEAGGFFDPQVNFEFEQAIKIPEDAVIADRLPRLAAT